MNALQQALDALKNCVGDSLLGASKRAKAIEVLKTELEQQGAKKKPPSQDDDVCVRDSDFYNL